MKVRECEKCSFYQRRTWSMKRYPKNYHAIGQTFAYGYCRKENQRCAEVRCCQERKVNLLTNVRACDAWLSPDGEFYLGDAHDYRAEEILEFVYGFSEEEVQSLWAGDALEKRGWVRLTWTPMWEVRLKKDYWNDKHLTQKQMDALWDWCQCHGKQFPYRIVEKHPVEYNEMEI